MSVVMLILSAVSFVLSVLILSVSKGVFHEIEAILMGVCSVLFFIGGFLLALIEDIRDKLEESEETRKIERMQDRSDRKNRANGQRDLSRSA